MDIDTFATNHRISTQDVFAQAHEAYPRIGSGDPAYDHARWRQHSSLVPTYVSRYLAQR